ncbi:MAG TPA: SPOR domain-containing protein [Burkholderiaceae bacterium]|nr:SPOR domain-containing protein [Burkholderiaceae bacterium]
MSRSRASAASGDANDPTAALRVRARRRLIGAAALLLAVAIVVPLLLDRAPRPTVDNIPIDIPSEKTPFTPRISLPPVPDAGQTPIAPPPDFPAAEPDKGKADAKEAKPAETKVKSAPDAKAPETTAKSKNSRIVLQAAALSTDAAAQDLSERLRKAGFATFTEKVDTADGVRFRVRVGPYATRDEAQRAQARLRSMGVSATLVAT